MNEFAKKFATTWLTIAGAVLAVLMSLAAFIFCGIIIGHALGFAAVVVYTVLVVSAFAALIIIVIDDDEEENVL